MMEMKAVQTNEDKVTEVNLYSVLHKDEEKEEETK